ncbi:MAG: FAD-dependent monooxygenase [Myxococcaceae bacterium]
MSEVEVVVVGGSLVGLSAAVFLAAKGVRVLVVEKHRASHPHPRAVGFTPRTLEVFAEAGVHLPPVPAGFSLKRRRVESVAGAWHEDRPWTPGAKPELPDGLTPFPTGAAIAQDRLEPLLRARALELGATLWLGAEVVSFTQDSEGVTVEVRRGEQLQTVRAPWLVACDGSRSAIREALGVRRQGRGLMRVVRSVLFHARLDEGLTRGVHQFEVQQPGLDAFLTTYGDDRWVLMFLDDVERDEATMRADIARAIGVPPPFEILTTGRWDLTALVADRFSVGRVFLAGDAAHTLPPTRGGFGANTGIHDVHNLAWKLAAVLQGTSSPRLLESYSQERQPIAWQRLLQTFARPDYAREAQGLADGVTVLGDVALELGALHRSDVLPVDAGLPAAAHPLAWRGQPGTRVPWLPLGVGTTHDLVGRGWVVFSRRAFDAGAALEVVSVDAVVAAALGLDDDEAVCLVRPDGLIAWRGARRELAAAHARAAAHLPK